MEVYTSLRCYDYVLANPRKNCETDQELPALEEDENPGEFPILQEENQKAKAWRDKVEDRVQAVPSVGKS